jgi:dihydrofolate synthase/folylpolyglutamate synthase
MMMNLKQSIAAQKKEYEHTDEQYLIILKKLFDLSLFGERFDLKSPKQLNHLLDNPLSSFKSIIVGGTNGKGSTCAYLEALALDAGLKVGLFTSPHLISFRERIKVNGQMIPEAKVVEGLNKIFECTQNQDITPAFFEFTWALALWYFREQSVDFVIWEVGLGGRLDATNACDPIISAVVSVGLDHCQILGNTLDEIAREKVGIFRKTVPCLTADIGEGLEAILRQSPYPVQVVEILDKIKQLEILQGEHQQRNASLAWTMSQLLHWPCQIQALAQVNWPGRLEKIEDFWIDCTHNPHGAQALAKWLESQNAYGKVHLIFGAMAGKDISGVLAPLVPFAKKVTFTTPQYPRRMSADELSKQYGKMFKDCQIIDNVAQAIAFHQKALENQKIEPSEMLLIAGSCYLAGESKAYFLDIPFPEGGLITYAR